MTLFRLLLIALVVLVSSLTASSLWLYLRTTQDFLSQQLAVHGADTATSLGLSLAPVLAGDDWVLAGSMVDAIYDSGEYSLLVVEELEGKQSIVRQSVTFGEETPAWFRRLFPLKAPVMETEVTGGWITVARLSVQANPARAQDHLWQLTERSLWIALALALIAIGIGALLLRRILEPLAAARRQADGIRKRRYLRQPELPKIRELRSLVLAMNQMVTTSEALFKEQCQRIERLRQQTLLDADTGLGNLTRARKRLCQVLKDRELDGGMVARLHLVGLDKVELARGVDGEQTLMQQLADILNEWILKLPNARVYRVGFADFLLLLPGSGTADLSQWEGELRQRVLVTLKQWGGQRVLLVAKAYRLDEEQSALEGGLEALLSQVLGREEDSLYLLGEEDGGEAPSLQQQEQQLARVLNHPPRLMVQPIQDAKGETLFQEVLARFHDGERWIAPGPVMVMVARQQRHQALDGLVLDTLLSRAPSARPRTVNLTVESVLDPLFLPELRRRLQGRLGTLALEVPERAYLVEPTLTSRFIDAMAELGVPVWLDHTTPSGLPLLMQTGLTGIKLDAAYTRSGLEEGCDLIEMMVAAAHARGVLVVAEQVEDPELAERLWQLGVDGVQGFAVMAPRPLGPEDGPAPVSPSNGGVGPA
ncbi:LapD/MoxY N-terminal periplasmic domain-containing protein [Ferrimonas balearica]|uniref:bifunctional diguanylate cyclase/phosphodiesterase n=1 Tax=Ferrimonas balearica TaxID=44012 RepID=UPI001C9A2139|nr:LapD/MoxY N-terminal periplasmic domain-containing protein [Ferrimonas balearica]MBY5922575.1 EAL domain-containing protein [Ferrimonas balearica]MBY5995559.1 EAL domain-containing protein [Ferrimonas balearica]